MKTHFVGRKKELEVLEKAYSSIDSAFIPIYGRRRVGKSELILKFMEQKNGIYFLGKKATAGLQMQEFLGEAAIAFEEPLLASYPVQDWKKILTASSEKFKKHPKTILVFDEFQWTAEASPELPSILQEFWDQHWRRQGNVVLILCGSYIGFMEREVLGEKSPLFGRRTAQILLKPFGYTEATSFHSNYSILDRAKTYFLCGGIPLYLRSFSTEHSVETNVIENFLNEFATLYKEPDFLLREELREIENYYAILVAIATGATTNQLISKQTDIGERSLHYYLQHLTELGYLKRRYPLTGDVPTQRSVRFVLEDPVLRFWFRFVYPHTSFIRQMGGVKTFKELIQPYLDSYFGICFEGLCREALAELYHRERVSASFQIGEYWDKNVQIDVVGIREDGWTDLGECKWGTIASVPALLDDLETKVQKYPNKKRATIGKRLFLSRPGTKKEYVKKATQGVRVHFLEDLY